MQLTPSTGSLLPWQRAAGWPSRMWLKRKNPFSSATGGDIQKHQMARVHVFVFACRKWMSSCVNVLSISSLPPMMKPAVSEGRGCSFVTDITLCSVKNNQLACTVYPCYPSTPTTSPPQWLWPSLSYHWLVRAASCFFCISVDERMRVRERQSHEPVPSVFFSPMFLPTRCLPPTLSQQRWNFSASSLARFLVLSSCSLPVTLPSTICTFCFSHTLCLSFLNSTFFILTFFFFV